MVLLWTSLGSLLIILLVTMLVGWLKLGDVTLADEDDARHWAEDQIPGFRAGAAFVDRSGTAALVAEADGRRIALIKRHGAHFAVRPVQAGAPAQRQGDQIIIDSGERQFGALTLEPTREGADKLLTMM